MRTLSTTLQASQESKSRKPSPRLYLSHIEGTVKPVDWVVSAAGSSKAEIDTSQHYGGTRSARLYRDGTNDVVVDIALTPITNNQSISLCFRKDDTSIYAIGYGNGTKAIRLFIDAAEEFFYYDGDWQSVTNISINTWYLLEINNVDWTAGTFDIYLNGSLIKSDATMWTTANYNGIFRQNNPAGTSEVWFDNFEIKTPSEVLVRDRFEWGEDGDSLDTEYSTTVTEYTYEADRIIRIEHGESETSHATRVILSNADKSLTDLDLKGYDAVLSHGLVTTAGKEYSACAPLKVLDQKYSSVPGDLTCVLDLIGIPDRLKLDKASDDYEHSADSVKTVKDLITEIADGQPVTEELPEVQESFDGYINLDNAVGGVGQRLSIPNRIITKISFKLLRTAIINSGDVTFLIKDAFTGATLASKVLGAASTISDSTPTWYEVTLDTPVTVNKTITWEGGVVSGGVYLYCQYTAGDASHYISVAVSSADVKANEWAIQFNIAGDPLTEWYSKDCAYRYKFTGAGIEVYDHCESYYVVYDSEDSLIDSYIPADSFQIKEGEDRLAVIDKLLYHTGCQRRFGADGDIHVFVPTITGTTYAAEFSLSTGHTFFAKSVQKGLVTPNKITVKDDDYSGSATSAASYALLPVEDFYRTALESDAQAASLAAAMISRLEIAKQQGGATVPVNCGLELYDYVNVTDAREGDSRTGNIGSLSVIYQAERGNTTARYDMYFSFGKTKLGGVAGTKISNLVNAGLMKSGTSDAIPWDELYSFLQDVADNLRDINVALGWVESQTPADEIIEDSLTGYMRGVVKFNDYSLSGRVSGTIYQAEYYPRLVTVSATHTYLAVVHAYIGQTSPPTKDAGLADAPAHYASITFLVPPGWYYKVVVTTTSLQTWAEWIIGG